MCHCNTSADALCSLPSSFVQSVVQVESRAARRGGAGSNYTRVSRARRAGGQGSRGVHGSFIPPSPTEDHDPPSPSPTPLNCISGCSFLVLLARAARIVTTSNAITAVHCSVLCVHVHDNISSRFLVELTDRHAGVTTFSTTHNTAYNTRIPWLHSSNRLKSFPRG